MQANILHPIKNSKWNFRILGTVDMKKQARAILPHYSNQDIDNENTFLNRTVQELQIGDGTKKWTVLKTSVEMKQFFSRVKEDMIPTTNITGFTPQFQKSAPSLIQSREFYRQFFEIQFLELKKVASLKMQKKSGGRYSQKCFSQNWVCQPSWLFWKQKDFVITQDGILYLGSDGQVEENMPFSRSFNCAIGPSVPQQFGIIIASNHRKLYIKANNFRNYFTFLYYLNKATKVQQKRQHFQYESFGPMRKDNELQFIIDGEDYFRKVAKVLQEAKVQVLIAGWWVSPQVSLIRDKKSDYTKYRLDKIIKSLADRKVKVYIIVYRQSSFVSNDSQYTSSIFKRMGPDVKIIRHPDIFLPSFWTHHEKIIIVDQSIAFIGGIDLCYGRFDDKKHSIQDNSVERYPGIQYSNARIKDFSNVYQYKKDTITRDLPRLPWHDVSVLIFGPSVKDACHHFIQYWNFAQFQTNQLRRSPLVIRSSRTQTLQQNQTNHGEFRKFFKKNLSKINKFFYQQTSPQQQQNPQLKMEQQNEQRPQSVIRLKKIKSLQPNFVFKSTLSAPNASKQNLKYEQQNQYPQNLTKSRKQFQIQQNLKEQINRNKQEQDKNLRILDQLQKENPIDQTLSQNNQYKPPSQDSIRKMCNTKRQSLKLQNPTFSTFGCQFLRSASKWTIGCKSSATQRSVQTAYLSLIANAKNYIYIQNQYFISSIKQQDICQNMIAQAIYNRIAKAIRNGQKFYIVVMMPLIPAFPGQISLSQARIPRVILHWQYRTICRHKRSLLPRIAQLTSDPSQYIKFYSLRTHGMIYDTPFTQILYVHSKLLIVDDCKVIIGSANINQRSMNGDRDSEIAVLIQGQLDKQITLGDNSKRRINQTIYNLRMQLWQEHFGLATQILMDPLNYQNMRVIQKVAKKNTQVYRKVFGCYPDDNIRKMKDISKLKKQANIQLYHEEIKNIVGHVVQMPMLFLEGEVLTTLTPDAISI